MPKKRTTHKAATDALAASVILAVDDYFKKGELLVTSRSIDGPAFERFVASVARRIKREIKS